jgi:hypothetical protein
MSHDLRHVEELDRQVSRLELANERIVVALRALSPSTSGEQQNAYPHYDPSLLYESRVFPPRLILTDDG